MASGPRATLVDVAETNEAHAIRKEERALREEAGEYEALEQAERARRQAHLAHFRELVAPLSPELLERATRIHDASEFSVSFDAEERFGCTIVSFGDFGNGVESSWDVTKYVFREGTQVLRISYGGADGSYVQELELDTPIDDATRADLEQAFDTRIAHGPQDPRYGLSQLFVSAQGSPASRRGTGFAVVGPLYPAYARPAAFPLLPYEDRDVTPNTLVEGGGTILRVAPIHTECIERTVGAHRLRHCGLAGRNGGVAVALMTGAESGLWVLETRNAVLGGELEWSGEHHGWVFGFFGGSHSGGRYAGSSGVVALRTSDGSVFRIDVDGAFVDGSDVNHWDRESRQFQQRQACVDAEVQRRELDEADVAALSACEMPELALRMDAGGLLVTRPDGTVARVEFNTLLRVLPH
ncbi:MAG: hypothetical protein ACI9KE_005831 [Polyangiales bacterium]|jgi:hypothetical protein